MIIFPIFKNGYKKIASVCFAIILLSCNKSVNDCDYIQYAGKAVITSINIAPPNENNCLVNPQKVQFVFVPNDMNARESYLFKNWSDSSVLTCNGGINPSQIILDSLDITVGKEFRCYRKEIRKGTCTPVIFEIEEVDLSNTNNCK